MPPRILQAAGTSPSLVGALSRKLTVKDLMTGLVAIAAVIGALGWSFSSPQKQISMLSVATAARFDSTNHRVGANEHRLETLEEQQRFSNYMLCVLVRRSDPAAVPPDCPAAAPIPRGRP
jgi:hypothetical protein